MTYHKTRLWACCRKCGSPDVQCTTWIEINTDKVIDGDSPTDDYYCPVCENGQASLEWFEEDVDGKFSKEDYPSTRYNTLKEAWEAKA